MTELLFEIGCEEIPASYIEPALAGLKDAAHKELTALRMAFATIETFGTPRRLVMIVKGLSDAQSDLTVEVLGPRAEAAFNADGSLTPQALGFLSAKKIDPKSAYRKQTPKGEVLAAQLFQKGQSAKTILVELLPKLMREMTFPKVMRWESSGATFARPVRWIVALLGSEVVPFAFADVKSAAKTTGHRFLAPQWETVNGVSQYLDLMKRSYVMLSADERRQAILSDAEKLAKEQGGTLVKDDALLDIVKNLVEYPWPLVGEFEDRYLDIPREILICEMREHQKYFAIQGASRLQPRFVVVAGSEPHNAKKVAAGHARVLRARFEDGSFYYYEDLKTPLADFVSKLARVQFQRELGSVLDKASRIERLSGYIARTLHLEPSHTLRAAQLCKADLVSGVVSQFPELQGVMGAYYAEKAGESKEVVAAIREHYWPRFAGDTIPSTDAGSMISLADKLDTLVGVIGIGKMPKGNADPFALRRAAIGVARIIIEKQLRLSLKDLVVESVRCYGDRLKAVNIEEIVNFVLGRARGVFSAHATILDGAIAAGSDDLADLSARIEALTFVQEQDRETFAQLAAGLKRAGNIVAKAVSDKVFDASSKPDLSVLQHASEKQLLSEIEKMQRTLEAVRQAKGDLQKRYVDLMKDVAALKPHVDRFFDDVMVMVEDSALRSARLALLNQLQRAASVVADFTKMAP